MPIARGLIERLQPCEHPVLRDRAGSGGGGTAGRRRHLGDRRRERQRATPIARRAPTGRGLLVANCEDTVNTNITLTAREVAADVPIAAVVEEDDAVDILQLSGATHVLPLKHQLGEYLANRVDVGRVEAHVVGATAGCRLRSCPPATRRLPVTTVRRHAAARDRPG